MWRIAAASGSPSRSSRPLSASGRLSWLWTGGEHESAPDALAVPLGAFCQVRKWGTPDAMSLLDPCTTAVPQNWNPGLLCEWSLSRLSDLTICNRSSIRLHGWRQGLIRGEVPTLWLECAPGSPPHTHTHLDPIELLSPVQDSLVSPSDL